MEGTFARTLARFQLGQMERQGMNMEQLKAAARGDKGAITLAVPQDEYRRAASIVLSPFAVAAVQAQNMRVVRQAQGAQEGERKRQESHTSATVYASALLHTGLEQEHASRLEAVRVWEGSVSELGAELTHAGGEEDELLEALEALQVHHATAASESKGMLSVVTAHRQRLLQELDAVISDVDSRKSAQREGIKAAIRQEEWTRGQAAIDAAHAEVGSALEEIRAAAASELGKVGKRLQTDIIAELQPMLQEAEAGAKQAAAQRVALEGNLEDLQGSLNSIVQSSADMEMRLQSEETRLGRTLDVVAQREGVLALGDAGQAWLEGGASGGGMLTAAAMGAATHRDAARLDLRLHLWNLTHTLYSDVHSYVGMLDDVEEIAVEGCQAPPSSRTAMAETQKGDTGGASFALAAAEMGVDTDVADVEAALFELYVSEYEGLRGGGGAGHLPALPSWGVLSQVAQEEANAAAAVAEADAEEEERRLAATQARAAKLSKSRRGRRPVSSNTPRAAPAGFGSSNTWSSAAGVGTDKANASNGSPGAAPGSVVSAQDRQFQVASPIRRAVTAGGVRRAAESKEGIEPHRDHAGLVWRQMTGLQR
jgi:hypothetical protein